MWNWAGHVECDLSNLFTWINIVGADTVIALKCKKLVEYLGWACSLIDSLSVTPFHLFPFLLCLSKFRDRADEAEICSPAVIQSGCSCWLSPYLPHTARQQWHTHKCMFHFLSYLMWLSPQLAKGFVWTDSSSAFITLHRLFTQIRSRSVTVRYFDSSVIFYASTLHSVN